MINSKTAVPVLWFMLLCVVCFGCFILKNRVHALETELSRINHDIQNNVKTIHILKAEWSLLNSPERLRQLTQEHTGLNKVRAEQIINYSALPFENESAGQAVRTVSNKEYKKLVKSER